jgi:hypothetical protein
MKLAPHMAPQGRDNVSNPKLNALQVVMQARFPAFLWAGPGVGKSAAIEQIAAGLDERLWTVILSIREPSDQGGLPIVRPDGVAMHPPLWASQLAAVGRGIVFFDEFNTAPPTTQSSALRVIHGSDNKPGYAGDLLLPEQTSFVAAGNPPETSTGGYDLTSAIANRWWHLDWTLEPGDWCNGMIAGWPKPVIHKLPEHWRNGVESKRGIVASFIRKKPDILFAMPTSATEQGRAWPSPRTWERVGICLAAASSIGLSDRSEESRHIIRGFVGEAATAEFVTWFVNLDLPDPEDLLLNPTSIKLPQRQDQIYACLDSLVAAALSKSYKRKDMIQRYRNAWKVFGRFMDGGQVDICVPAGRVLAQGTPPEVAGDLPPEFNKIYPLLKKSGITFETRA